MSNLRNCEIKVRKICTHNICPALLAFCVESKLPLLQWSVSESSVPNLKQISNNNPCIRIHVQELTALKILQVQTLTVVYPLLHIRDT